MINMERIYDEETQHLIDKIIEERDIRLNFLASHVDMHGMSNEQIYKRILGDSVLRQLNDDLLKIQILSAPIIRMHIDKDEFNRLIQIAQNTTT